MIDCLILGSFNRAFFNALNDLMEPGGQLLLKAFMVAMSGEQKSHFRQIDLDGHMSQLTSMSDKSKSKIDLQVGRGFLGILAVWMGTHI